MEIQLWRELLDPYHLAVEELTTKFNHMIEECCNRDMYCPIDHVHGRVKSVTSILAKLQRKKIPFEEIEQQVEDIAGMRIICRFVEDIEKVKQLLLSRSDIEFKAEKDYLNNAKPSGYRSYHLIVYYTVNTMNGPKKLNVEFQIRTMAMDFWATIEHSLQYKYKKNMPEHVRIRLSKAAEAILALDNEMSLVRNEIMDAQYFSQIKMKLVTDILTNIESLYKLANKREVMKIQDEFYEVYESNDMDQLLRFHRQLDVIAEGYRAQAVTKMI